MHLKGGVYLFENFDLFVEQKLLALHTAFIARVISVTEDEKTGEIIRKIQPVSLSKQYGLEAEKQAVIENIPILRHVGEIKKGDIVLCVCAERDITDSKRGISSLPPYGHHNINDAVIIGVICL